MKKFKKNLTLALTLVAVTIVSAIPVNAKTVTVPVPTSAPKLVKSSYAVVTTTSADKEIRPIYETQAYHKKGTQLTISVSKATTKSVSATATVTGEWNAGFASASVALGVGVSKSFTVTTSIGYTLKKEKSGRYRIETVFPGEKVQFDGYTKYNYGTRKEYSKTIGYAPKRTNAYQRINRYSS